MIISLSLLSSLSLFSISPVHVSLFVCAHALSYFFLSILLSLSLFSPSSISIAPLYIVMSQSHSTVLYTIRTTNAVLDTKEILVYVSTIVAFTVCNVLSIAVCATPCGLNKHCSQPDQCTCIRGWRGDECQRGESISFRRNDY